MESIRGKLLKVPDATPGLLFVNGQQKTFEINGIWKSAAVAPAAGMTVDVGIDDRGAIIAVCPVADSDLAKEQAKKAVDAAGEKSKQLATMAVARVGKSALVAIALLIVSWFFLDYCSTTFDASVFNIKTHITFWQGMGALNVIGDDLDNLPQLEADLAKYSNVHGEKPSAGIYGVLCILVLAGPLLPMVWKDKRALLGAALPLLFTLCIIGQDLHFNHSIQESVRTALTKEYTPLATGDIGGIFGMGGATQPVSSLAAARVQAQVDKDMEQFKKTEKFSLGLGFYISLLAVLYLAADGAKKYLALKASAA